MLTLEKEELFGVIGVRRLETIRELDTSIETGGGTGASLDPGPGATVSVILNGLYVLLGQVRRVKLP